jgi:hypothetical protein
MEQPKGKDTYKIYVIIRPQRSFEVAIKVIRSVGSADTTRRVILYSFPPVLFLTVLFKLYRN